jgi:hypothetical protein
MDKRSSPDTQLKLMHHVTYQCAVQVEPKYAKLFSKSVLTGSVLRFG